MTAEFHEPGLPALPARLRRPLLALWVSLTIHAALLVFIQVAPSGGPPGAGVVLQARLDPATPPAPTPPTAEPDASLQPSPTLETTEKLGASPAPTPPAPIPEPAPPTPAAPPSEPPSEPPAEPARPSFAIDTGVDLTYYTARELDKQAMPERDIDFVYPPDADRTRVSGSVRVQLKVEADGRVSDIEILAGNPPGVFDTSVQDAFGSVRFVPAQKAGRPVRALMVIEVRYDWDGQR